MKRLGAFLMTVILTGVAVWGLQDKYEDSDSFSLTAGDSIAADTINLANTPHYYNRVQGVVIFKPVADTNGANAWGSQDSISGTLYATFPDGFWYSLATATSTYAPADGGYDTLTLRTDVNDSLFLENLVLILRMADTSSAQDSDFTIPYSYQLLHTFAD